MKSCRSLIVIAGLGSFVLFSGCHSRSLNMEKAKPLFKISAEKLFKEYKGNWTAASAKYQGKVVEVTGTVERTGEDSAGSPYVNLTGDPAVGGVQCFFAKGHDDEAAQAKPGQPLTVKGESTVFVINVVIERCVIVK